MPEIYRTAPVKSDGESAALVLHCSDPRYEPHFQEFLGNGLGLRRYALIAVPGGAQFLTLVDYLPKFSWVGWRWMKFMTELARPHRLILIAHEDCHWYLHTRFGHDPSHVRDQQIADLEHVRRSFVERFGARPVDLYYAHLEGDRAVFESL